MVVTRGNPSGHNHFCYFSAPFLVIQQLSSYFPFCLRRVLMTREGGSVLGGCYCHAFFLVASVCLTLPPSRYITTLPVWWVRLVFGGFARIGRVFLSMEGGMVACVLNREAGTVGNGWLGWGFGGWNCSGRAVLACIFAGCVCLPDVITLRGQNDLPGAKSPSSNRITLLM